MLCLADAAAAEVVRIDVRRRDDWGAHERVIGRVHFAVDPALPANRAIADLDRAPRNANGKVGFSSDLLFFRPKDPRQARGTVFLEVVNRGRDQSLAILSGAQQRDLAPESWNLGDGFLLEQGFAVAFLGWQFDVRPIQGLTFAAPTAPVEGLVRDTHIEVGRSGAVNIQLSYCAAEPGRTSTSLTFRARMDETPRPLRRRRGVTRSIVGARWPFRSCTASNRGLPRRAKAGDAETRRSMKGRFLGPALLLYRDMATAATSAPFAVRRN